MENIKNLWEWFKSLKTWKKCVLPILVAIVIIVCSVSCSTTKAFAKISNKATGTSTTVTITGTNGGSVSVQASPDVTLDLKSVDTIKPSKIIENE